MKRFAFLSSVVLCLLSVSAPRAAEYKPYHLHKKNSAERKSAAERETRTGITIRVAEGDWGNAEPKDIETLLNAVADELLSHFPQRHLDPIVVSHSRKGPVVLYERGPDNAYQVQLAAKGDGWAEYVYEFSHELFHILANYDYHAPPRKARNQWFEEMLCETASLYTLKRFSLKWEQSPPRPEWVSYAPAMHRFTWRALNEPHRQLPNNISFTEWFEKHRASLSRNPYLREKNELVAHFFLPLLEQNRDWQAITYLNSGSHHSEANFFRHIDNWYRNTPPAHRGLVRDAMKVFHFHEPAARTYVASADAVQTYPGDDREPVLGAAGRAGR